MAVCFQTSTMKSIGLNMTCMLPIQHKILQLDGNHHLNVMLNGNNRTNSVNNIAFFRFRQTLFLFFHNNGAPMISVSKFSHFAYILRYVIIINFCQKHQGQVDQNILICNIIPLFEKFPPFGIYLPISYMHKKLQCNIKE